MQNFFDLQRLEWRMSRTVSSFASCNRRHGGSLAVPVLALVFMALCASAFIAYVLWPRWPDPVVAADTPAIPVMVAGVVFNIPPAAMRVPVQRHPGKHERIDLAFLWPSLDPPDPASNSVISSHSIPGTATKSLERLFVTISASGDTMPPAERVKSIYPRYTTANPESGPDGLSVLAFQDGTPYQGEDLIYDAEAPDNFIVRCSRHGAGPTPGMCLLSQRIETADVIVRFPRDWLGEWRIIAAKVERLISAISHHAG
jgi:hypothetical protein